MASLFIETHDSREQVTAETLWKLFVKNESFDKIQKNQLFKNDKKRNKNFLGSRNATNILPYFRIKHPETGLEVIVRYAETSVPVPGEKNRFKYTPFRIPIYGNEFSAFGEIEKAVWLYINRIAKKDSEYSYIDKDKLAENELSKVDDIEKALLLSRTTSDEDVYVLLKGFSRYWPQEISDVESMSTQERRASFRSIALNHPKSFLGKVENSKLTKIEGTVLMLADKGAISIIQEGPWKIWKWTSGPRIGESIGDVIKEATADTREILVREILSNPEAYKETLSKTLSSLKSAQSISEKAKEWDDFDDESAHDAISSIVTKDDLPNNEDSLKNTSFDSSKMKLPVADLKEIRDFCDTHGFKKGAVEVSIMKKAIDSNECNQENLAFWCDKNLKKSSTE